MKSCQRTFPAWPGNEAVGKFNEDKCEVTQMHGCVWGWSCFHHVMWWALNRPWGLVLVLWRHQCSSGQSKRQARNYWERSRKHTSLCNTKSLFCQMLVLVLGFLFPEGIIGLEKVWWKSSKRLIKVWNSFQEWRDWVGWGKEMTEGK